MKDGYKTMLSYIPAVDHPDPSIRSSIVMLSNEEITQYTETLERLLEEGVTPTCRYYQGTKDKIIIETIHRRKNGIEVNRRHGPPADLNPMTYHSAESYVSSLKFMLGSQVSFYDRPASPAFKKKDGEPKDELRHSRFSRFNKWLRKQL